ncbi:hypothetical protein BO223_03870 [Faecalibaculum rodentium]|uniref:Uncharacterized protein n=1 Tax=Faecalibaculum rodentium TaxID=1702221 RepID=A0A1Q9YLQ4_9FIRM|nr:hypothetical protein BO223_03870 [Faecalibaculum rodentium]
MSRSSCTVIRYIHLKPPRFPSPYYKPCIRRKTVLAGFFSGSGQRGIPKLSGMPMMDETENCMTGCEDSSGESRKKPVPA